uniref:RAD50-interacting protein 1 n=1 Tax=Plectus sambesii TaxID=2011161 RepID=A0A914WCM9_9BILA
MAPSESESDQIRSVRERLNALNPRDARGFLSAVREMSKNMKKQKEELLSEVYYQQSELPTRRANLQTARQDLNELRQKVVDSIEGIEADRQTFEAKVKKNAPDLLDRLKNLNALERALAYLCCVQRISDLSSSIGLSLVGKDWPSLLERFLSLKELIESLDHSTCENLLQFARATLEALVAQLSTELPLAVGQLLDQLHYPLDDVIDLKGSQKQLKELQALLKCIQAIHSNMSNVDSSEESSNEFSTASSVLRLLFEPMQKRFHYHFYGDRKTNDVEKPEWFFTQLVGWAQAHAQLFDVYVQPVVEEKQLLATFEMQRFLMGLAAEKMNKVVEGVSGNSVTFSHLIDETVIFEMEMHAIGYPETAPNVLEIFAGPILLPLWLELERDSCTSSVESLLQSDDRWADRFRDASDIDEMRVPECADSFVTLLQLITERYRLLRSFEARAQLLQMQLQLLDDFRTRLVHISRNVGSPWITPFPQLMNAFWYIAHVLEEWNDLPFFVQLQGVGVKEGSGKRIQGAFESTIELYRHGWNQNCSSLIRSFVDGELKVVLDPYKRQKWYSYESGNPVNVSGSLCPFLLTLRGRLGQLSAALSNESLAALMRQLIGRVGRLFIDEIITQSSFNSYGAAQIRFDVASALIPLLNSVASPSSSARISSEHDVIMAELNDKLKVLSLPVATVLLLRETLLKTPTELTADTIAELNVYTLNKEAILDLLNQRSDMSQ